MTEIVNVVTSLISSVGFPIFVCCALFWYIYKVETKQTEALTKLTEAFTALSATYERIKDK